MSPEVRLPAIVPAAGESRRMGLPKLLLEFDGLPLIGRVVSALRDGGADPVVVIAPPETTLEGRSIVKAAHGAGARVLAPSSRPAEMRDSVELGLAEVTQEGPPAAILLTPADSPALSSRVVAEVIAAWGASRDRIVIACSGGKHAHPIILPWDVAELIPALPRDRGVNSLVEAHAGRVVELEIDQPGPGLAVDLNTPEDLARWRGGETSRLTIRLFAIAKERAGRPEIEVHLPLPATVAQLRRAIASQHPGLASLSPSLLIAVDSDYAKDDYLIAPGSKLALIPPVSGG